MKNKKCFFFWALVIFFGCFFVSLPKAQAAIGDFKAYALETPDTTPTVRGSVAAIDVGTITVTVQIEGRSVQNVTTFDSNGNWSLDITSALAEGNYDYTAIATLGVSTSTITWTHGLHIDTSHSFDIYWYGTNKQTAQFIEFPASYLYSASSEGFEVSFDHASKVTRTGGGTFDASVWYAEKTSADNDKFINQIRLGIENEALTLSTPATITFNVGTSYNGQTLYVYSKEDGGGDDDWESETSCVTSSGQCMVDVSHASYFAISKYDDLFENEKAHIDSWKAYKYTDSNKACSNRLKLIIKGKDFDDDAEVKIGNHQASSVNKKSSKEIVAKFCMDKLLKDKNDKKEVIRVINPDADEKKADKKIDLNDVDYDTAEENFDSQTSVGVQSIQKALAKEGLLGEQYITGFYGSITTEAVKKFQEKNGLPATGFVGSLTKAKLAD